ncbi:MAG: hypothetical protein J0I19_01295 [Alphaproteobacteria bacterium]|nr:hypothetical protein [Alphaproteobacteria bacterium]
MSDYWITFRLEANSSYEKRYDALYEAARSNATKWWIEPTSFIAMRSNLTIDALGQKLKSAIDASKDLILMREIGVKDSRYAGVISDEDFFNFFPDAKKL